MPRDGGNADLRWLEIPPCDVFHTVNAFEDGEHVDQRLTGRPHRYSYAADVRLGAANGDFGALVKYDGRQGALHRHDFGPGRAVGEGVFVPVSAAAGEDEGWVLVYVYDAARAASDLAILDATSFTAPPVAPIHLPQRVPVGCHGSWLPALPGSG